MTDFTHVLTTVQVESLDVDGAERLLREIGR